MTQPAAWVEKGRLKVEHSAHGPYPVVAPCREGRLFVNGKEFTVPVAVSKTDTVKIETASDFTPGAWSLEITPDRLTAFVRLTPARELKRELAELPPAAYLQLRVGETEHFLPPATLEEILDQLKEKNIVFGIDLPACLAAANCREEKELVVARGQSPEPGQDARVELLFRREDKSPLAAGGSKIDFRQRYAFNSVEAGEALAIKTPAAPGKPGKDVFGQPIAPPQPKEIALTAGKGATLTENGLAVVAAQAGLPRAKVRQNSVSVEVSPVLVHPQDVDLASGNISFKGNVLIQGNVGEGMRVEAQEDVRVSGYVAQGAVRAGGAVFIQGNVLSSEISAGGKLGFFVKGEDLLKEFSLAVTQLEGAIEQLRQIVPEKEVAQALPILFGTRFKTVPEHAKRLVALIDQLPADALTEELRQFAGAARKLFGGLPAYAEIPAGLAFLAEKADLLLTAIPPPGKEEVRLAYALNSTIKAAGNVLVFGDGCFNTTIEAGGSVRVKGVFRGGKIYARQNVFVGELGSRRGLKTLVTASEESSVFLGKAWDNTEVQIGKRTYKFIREENNVKLRLDKNGEIAVSYVSRRV